MSDTVLVTGIGGFIAKHVARVALDAGYSVRGTVRSLARADKITAALAAAGCDVSRLSFVEADLTGAEGWATAATGCRFVQHIASPFPMKLPRDREALVAPARDGALRVIDAALEAGTERIVMTSSIVAMMYRASRPSTLMLTEQDWTDPEWVVLSAYQVSKTRAEQAAWQRVRERGAGDRLTVVNPGFVLGPSLDSEFGTSLGVIKMMLRGAYPALPPSAYPIVDVRDLADVHVRAMTTAEAAGRRLLTSGETKSLAEIGVILRDGLGRHGRAVPTRELPGLVVRAAAMIDPALKAVLADLGTRPIAQAGYVTDMTGVAFRPAQDAVLAAARSLLAHDRALAAKLA